MIWVIAVVPTGVGLSIQPQIFEADLVVGLGNWDGVGESVEKNRGEVVIVLIAVAALPRVSSLRRGAR